MRKRRILFTTLCVLCLSLVSMLGCLIWEVTELYAISGERTYIADLVSDNYYYQTLETDSERLAYQEMYKGILAREDTITVKNVTELERANIWRMVIMDISCLNTVARTFDEVSLGYDEPSLTTSLKPNYLLSLKEESKRQEKIDNKAEKIISELGLRDEPDSRTKALLLHNYLIENVFYRNLDDNTNTDVYEPHRDAYGALMEGSANCLGYASAYKTLMEKVGIPTEVVKGYIILENGEKYPHAWNRVWIDDKWYFTDVCWDDVGDESNSYQLLYFLLSEEAMYGANNELREESYSVS